MLLMLDKLGLLDETAEIIVTENEICVPCEGSLFVLLPFECDRALDGRGTQLTKEAR